MIAKELKIRGFIEGVEVPIISATVSTAPNSPASASIEIIATDAAHELKPRSVVHLFFKDLYQTASANVYTAGEGIEAEYEIEKHFQILEEEQYRLLFCGEVMGYQFNKTPQARQITLQCADFSVYWDTSYYFSGGGFFSPSHLKKKFSMASGGFFEHLLLSKGEKVYKQFTTPPQGYPGVTGVLGGLIHLMQSVGGIYWKGGNKFGGLNPFFSIAELKFHLTQQIAAANDDGPKKLLKGKGFGSIWNKSIRGLGKNFNYRQVINALQKYIFYEVYPCPVARYVPGTGIYDEPDTSTKLLRNHPEYGYYVIAANQFQKSVERLLEDFMREERALTMQEYRSSLKRMRNEMKSYVTSARTDNLQNVMKNLTKVRGRISTLLKKQLGNKLPDKGSRYKDILKSLNFIDDKLRAIYGFTIPGKKEDQEDMPPFLYTQLFRPDIWFSPPPRCNVIFPEQYYQIQFGRNYMGEITRLLLRTHSSFFGSDILFDNFYYAPALPGEKQKKTPKKGKKIPSLVEKSYNKLVDSKRDVMEHELYTGVLPKFERAGSHQVLGLRTGSTLTGGQTEVGYAQRLANFLFFKYRYAARTVSVVGQFNPYLAPGFPCLILDKPSDKDQIDKIKKALSQHSDDLNSIKGLTGTHYLGMIAGMVHALNQQGGQTTIQLQYARTHREEVEALGADIINKNKEDVRRGWELKESYVCALYEPSPGQRGLYSGEIWEVKEIPKGTNVKTKEKKKKKVKSETESEKLVHGEYYTVEVGGYVVAKEFPLLGTHIKKKGKKVKWKKKFDTLIRPWEKKPASEFGPEVVGLVGSSTAQVEFRLFHIVEEVPKPGTTETDLPLEDIVRPPWYSTIWFNKSIGGAVYDKFFGTTAITDPLTILDEYQDVSVPNEEQVEVEAAKSDVDSEEDVGYGINVITDIEQNTSIENAVDQLAYAYSAIKEGGYDIDEFVRSYTWRPVANMVDMFGTPDLELEYSGDVGKSPVVAVQGQEGFHSRAFGDYKDLFGLVSPSVGQLIGVRNQFDPANARLDVRREKWLRVLAYVLELQEQGLRG